MEPIDNVNFVRTCLLVEKDRLTLRSWVLVAEWPSAFTIVGVLKPIEY